MSKKLEQLKQDIAEVVERHWEEKAKPILFSKLGMESSISARLKEISIGLSDFLSVHLKNEVFVYQDKSNPIRLFAFPIEAQKSAKFNPQKIIDEVATKADEGIRRYNFSLWAAFKKPIEPDFGRYVSIDSDNVSFIDLPRGKSRPADSIKIAYKFLNKSIGKGPEVIAPQIEAWLLEKNIEESSVYILPEKRNKKTLLTSLFSALSDEELAEVKMPLSIVKKLSEKK